MYEEGRLTSSGGRLSGVDVADNDDVDMSLLLTAVVVSIMCWLRRKRRLKRLEADGETHPMMAVVL